MIERLGAAALGTATAAAAATPSPVIWQFLGYPFEAASMIAAVFAAVTTRVIINRRNRSTAIELDLAVLALVLVTTVAVVAGMHTNLIGGLLYGTGIATIGEGLIRIAEKYTTKGLEVLGIENPPPPAAPVALPVRAPTGTDDAAAIERLTGDLNKID